MVAKVHTNKRNRPVMTSIKNSVHTAVRPIKMPAPGGNMPGTIGKC